MKNDDFIAADGTVMTPELVAELATEAEQGFPNSTLEPASGRPWEHYSEPMTSKSVRAPRRVWELVAKRAAHEGLSESEWLRSAITKALAL